MKMKFDRYVWNVPRGGRVAVITGNREARVAEAKNHNLARG